MKRVKNLSLLGLLIIALGIPSFCYAGREPEEWDTLPQIEILRFSKDAIGFMASDNRFFIFDRKSKSFRNLDQNTFLRLFPSSDNRKPYEILKNTGVGSTVLLRSSDGTEYHTQNAYCSEGEDEHHTLSRTGKKVTDHVDKCYSISTLEIVGDQLWLGTRADGEYGDYPAEGIVIQSLKSAKLIAKLNAKTGLTGNLIRIIRKDPYTSTVWIATQQGFNTIDQDFKIINTQYFYEDFDNQTGKSTIFLSPSLRQSNPLAVLERQLAVDKPKEFYDAVKQIPPDELEDFHAGTYSSVNARSIEEAFVPKEMNVLVPFFLKSAASGNDSVREKARSMLCMFYDERVVEFFVAAEKNPTADPSRYGWDCLNKYDQLGLPVKYKSAVQIEELLDRERMDLAAIKSSPPGDLLSEALTHAVAEVVLSLKKNGNEQGVELINQYFLASNGCPRDGSLYDAVVERLLPYDDILSAVLAGLKNLQSGFLYRGCTYFDMRYKTLFHPARYKAIYADAVLKGFVRASDLAQSGERSGTANYAKDICKEAFISQIQNDVVKQQFMGEYYSALTPRERAMANDMLR